MATYLVGDFVGRVSYYNPNQTVKKLSEWYDRGPAGELAGPVDYKFGDLQGERQVFCVRLIGSMLPERSKDDDNFERTAG